jgi:RHS repeat-associated protein
MTFPAACVSSVASGTPWHSSGKERDTESGNDYMFARYYNSATGRFLSPDWSAKEDPVPYAKLDNPQSLNLYSYVWNNPLSNADPDGHECKPCEAFYNAVHDMISVKTTASTGTHDSASFLGIKVGVSSGASISTTVRPFNDKPVEVSGENKSSVEAKFGPVKIEANLPMQTPTTPDAYPSASAGSGPVKVGSDGEISVAGIEVTPEGKGVGGGVEIQANVEDMKTAAKTLIPAVVGGIGEIFSGVIRPPQAAPQPLYPRIIPEQDR